MSIVKSYAVGNGDMFYIRHNSDNFTIIDCRLDSNSASRIIAELKAASKGKGIQRFICTHPDQDHFGGIELLDAAMPIANFYVVKNQATKSTETASFRHYCGLRDDPTAFFICKGLTRKWMNIGDEQRAQAGISILWPNLTNPNFIAALASCDAGESFNNTSAVIRYSVQGGASVLWLGDLETDFMESIFDDMDLPKTTIVFAAHHGRKSGKIPHSWLEKLDPQIIVIGEAPSRHLHYHTGYQTITQNRAWGITMDLAADKVHFYSSNPNYTPTATLENDYQHVFDGYFGSLTVETQYTLDAVGPQAS